VLLSPTLLFAAAENPESTKKVDEDIYFDAKHTTYDRKAKIQRFTGEVIAITANLLIAADTIVLDRQNETLFADGHVIIANREQIITGEHLEVYLSTREFVIKKATVLNQDFAKNQDAIARILGITAGEVQFNLSQKYQLQALEQQKTAIKREFLHVSYTADDEKKMLINRYALLLSQEEQIASHKYLDLQPLNAPQKSIWQKRRDFWQQQHDQVTLGSTQAIGYFRLEGEHINQIEPQHIIAEHGLFTPCRCQEGESPTWGFRASRIDAQLGGYADLDNSVLEIHGVPVLYLPFLRFPLKTKRQTGFLIPDLSYQSRDGNIFTAPLYFAINPWSDATLTTTFIEKRGWRLGVEYRSQYKNYSGWDITGEGIRDQLWLSQVAAHSRYRSLYVQLNPQPADSNGAEYVAPPPNTWRGKTSWHGLSILSDSLSLVSEGSLVSDHRYEYDFLYRYFANNQSQLRSSFAKAGVLLNIDREHYHASVSSRVADHSLSNHSFSGMQQPSLLTFQSRLFRVPSGSLALPLYGQLSIRHYYFHLIKEKSPLSTPPTIYALTLNDANWLGAQFKTYAPLNRNQAIQASFFSELDARAITPQSPFFGETAPPHPEFTGGIKALPSAINSLRTGLAFRLPLNGTRILSQKISEDQLSGATTFRTVDHLMNWDIVFSLRPYALRRGTYGDQFQLNSYDTASDQWRFVQQSEQLTYLSSDYQNLFDSPLIPEELVMTPHQKIIFKTDHRWLLREKQLKLPEAIPEVCRIPHAISEAQNWQVKARSELQEALQQVAARRAAEQEYLSATSFPSLLKHLQTSEEKQPVAWASQISYDYQKQRQREAQRRLATPLQIDKRLPEPWSTWGNQIALSWWQWTLSFSGDYNLYQKIFPQTVLSLQSPSLLHFKVGLSYKIEKQYQQLAGGDFTYFPRKTREISVANDYFDFLPLLLKYGETVHYPDASGTISDKMAAVGISYISSANCWGLKASWEKDYIATSWAGTYYLGLVVNFFNTSRTFGNLVSRYNDENIN
jgi:hypothetical protein